MDSEPDSLADNDSPVTNSPVTSNGEPSDLGGESAEGWEVERAGTNGEPSDLGGESAEGWEVEHAGTNGEPSDLGGESAGAVSEVERPSERREEQTVVRNLEEEDNRQDATEEESPQQGMYTLCVCSEFTG